MARLPRIADLTPNVSGWGFFLCTRKDSRAGRTGSPFLALVLQDVSGEIGAKVFQDVDATTLEFDAGEFVKVQGRSNLYQGRTELILDKIRRVMPDRDAADGFREEDCIRCAPRPVDEMWAELDGAHRQRAAIRSCAIAARGRWSPRMPTGSASGRPRARVHHAYRSGLLEHVLKIMKVVAVSRRSNTARAATC